MGAPETPPSPPADLLSVLSGFVQASHLQMSAMQEQAAAIVRAMETQAAELAELRKVLAKPSPLTHPAAKPSFTQDEACRYLGIGRTALAELMATRQIGYHQAAERGKVHFTQRQLDAWRDRHEVAATRPL